MQKILIVEYDYRVAEIHQKNFCREGLETFVAFDEKDALDVIRKEKVDVLLISEQVGGYEFVQTIHKNNPDMKIFVVGVGSPGGALEKDREKAIVSGANDFFSVVHVGPDKMLDIIMGRAKNDEPYFIDIQALFIVKKANSIISNPEVFLSDGIRITMISEESDLAQFSHVNHVCDIVLAEVDSDHELDMLKKLLEDKIAHPVSVIVLLGDDDQIIREKAERMGIINFLTKSEASHEQIAKRIRGIYNKMKFR